MGTTSFAIVYSRYTQYIDRIQWKTVSSDFSIILHSLGFALLTLELKYKIFITEIKIQRNRKNVYNTIKNEIFYLYL